MAEPLSSQPPRDWPRLRDAHAERGGDVLDAALGELCRVLAASRPGGVFLAMGEGAAAIATWIQDGMDLASRLVVLVEDGAARSLGAPFDDDLRITVHAQASGAFLEDVRAHRFDLIADLHPGASADVSPRALAVLAAGGFCVSRHDATALDAAIAAGPDIGVDTRSLVLTRLAGEPGITLVVRGPRRAPARRRGGRRARQGVTPLFSPRPRRGGS